MRVKLLAEEPTVQGSGLEPSPLALTGAARERLLASRTRDAAPDVSAALAEDCAANTRVWASVSRLHTHTLPGYHSGRYQILRTSGYCE